MCGICSETAVFRRNPYNTAYFAMNLDYELENMIETVWSRGYRFIAK